MLGHGDRFRCRRRFDLSLAVVLHIDGISNSEVGHDSLSFNSRSGLSGSLRPSAMSLSCLLLVCTLQREQKVAGLLRLTGCRENGLLVCLQNLEPVVKISGVIVANFGG